MVSHRMALPVCILSLPLSNLVSHLFAFAMFLLPFDVETFTELKAKRKR